jgi:uncharacterized protein (TIGR03067 family)
VGTVFLATFGLLLTMSGRSAADDKPKEKPLTDKSLQGVWRGARFDSGKGEDPEKGVKLELTFKDDQIIGKRLPTGDIGEGTIKLSKDGKEIDAVGTTSGYKGKTYLGIIKVDGDTLYWCTGTIAKDQKRPEKFEASPDQRTYLIVVKKEKP